MGQGRLLGRSAELLPLCWSLCHVFLVSRPWPPFPRIVVVTAGDMEQFGVDNIYQYGKQ